MSGPIDGGWSEADDVPPEQPEYASPNDWQSICLIGFHDRSREIAQDIEENKDSDALALKPGNGDTRFGELEPEEQDENLDKPSPEGGDIRDPSSDLQIEAHPMDQSALSESERKSITDSAEGWLKFAEERLISLSADVLLPGVGGRLADLTFEVLDMVNSVQALFSDDRVLEVPLPSPVPSLDFTLEIPLASGEDGEAAPPLALCVAPDSPSLTGGWALDADEHDDQQVQQPLAEVSEAPAEHFHPQQDPWSLPITALRVRDTKQRKPRATPQSAKICLVEADLNSLPLPRDRKSRAQALAILGYQYAPQLRENPHLRRFDLFIIADKGRRYGVWIWLDVRRWYSPPLLITPIGRDSR